MILRVDHHGNQRGALDRIAAQQLIEFFLKLRRNLQRSMGSEKFWEFGFVAQRSTSPRTMSVVPMQATTSAMKRPSTSLGSALQIHEGRRANLHAIWFGRAVAGHVKAQFAARRFDGLVNLAAAAAQNLR